MRLSISFHFPFPIHIVWEIHMDILNPICRIKKNGISVLLTLGLLFSVHAANTPGFLNCLFDSSSGLYELTFYHQTELDSIIFLFKVGDEQYRRADAYESPPDDYSVFYFDYKHYKLYDKETGFSAVAFDAGAYSDTSEPHTVITPVLDSVVKIPMIHGFDYDSCVTIRFYDSCNYELEYGIYRRKHFEDTFSLIHTITYDDDTSAINMGSVHFKDSMVVPSTWYTYKVAMTTPGNDEYIGPDSTMYTDKDDLESNVYSFSERGAIVTGGNNKDYWMEVWGDSLYRIRSITSQYYVEVIDISQEASPHSEGMFPCDEVPSYLEGTKIHALCHLGLFTKEEKQSRFLAHADYFFHAVPDSEDYQTSMLYQYAKDDLSTPLASKEMDGYNFEIIGDLTDSTFLSFYENDWTGHYYTIQFDEAAAPRKIDSLKGFYRFPDIIYKGRYKNKFFYHDNGENDIHILVDYTDLNEPHYLRKKTDYFYYLCPAVALDSITSIGVEPWGISLFNNNSSTPAYLKRVSGLIGRPHTTVLDTVKKRLIVDFSDSTKLYTYQRIDVPGHHVIYDGNGATSGWTPVDDKLYYLQDKAPIRNQGGLIRTGYSFTGWNSEPDGTGNRYFGGDTIPVGSADVILYAQWECSFAGGAGTQDSPFLIETADQLDSVRHYCDSTHYHFVLLNDIDLKPYLDDRNSYWYPISDPESERFNAQFDGNGFTISNIKIHSSSYDCGMFSYINNDARVVNLGIIIDSSSYVYGDGHVGGIAGVNLGRIENCFVTGTLRSSSELGGIAGYNAGRINNCYFIGAIGGATTRRVGGIAGTSSGRINNCYALAVIKGDTYVGGLAGYSAGIIRNSYARGCVFVNSESGGGLIGRVFSTTDVTNCYSTCLMLGSDSLTGGLAGRGDCPAVASFWDTQLSGMDSSATGTAQSSARMRMVSTYTDAGWDFDTLWNIEPEINGGYPYLRMVPHNTPEQYTLFYDPNGAQGFEPEPDLYYAGQEVVIPENTSLSKDGQEFTGWNTQPDGTGTHYAKGASIIIDRNTVLYASWGLGQTIAFDPLDDATYGDQPIPLRASATSLLPVSFTSTNEDVARISEGDLVITGAGITQIRAAQEGDSLYSAAPPVEHTLQVLPKQLAVSGLEALDKTYDGTTQATVSGGTLEGVVGQDEVMFTVGEAFFDDENAGADKPIIISDITLEGDDAENYQTDPNTVQITASIAPKPLTIAAADTSKGEGEDDPAFRVTYDGLISDDDREQISGLVVDREPGDSPGEYAIIPSAATAQNYDITFQHGILTILPSTAIHDNHRYGHTNPSSACGVWVSENPVGLYAGRAEFIIRTPRPSYLDITIFDQVGNVLFRKKDHTDLQGSKKIRWDFKNRYGQRVSSGTYLVIVTANVYDTHVKHHYRTKLGVTEN